MEAAAGELQDYVTELARRRREAPGDDFLSSYLREADQKGELSPLEIIVQIVVLIIGGTDTTRVAMAAQVALLLQHREQWDALCHDPALIPGAVAEALRYEPSVASVSRITTEDIEMDGQILPGGNSSRFRRCRPCATKGLTNSPTASTYAGPISAACTWCSAAARTGAWARRWPGRVGRGAGRPGGAHPTASSGGRPAAIARACRHPPHRRDACDLARLIRRPADPARTGPARGRGAGPIPVRQPGVVRAAVDHVRILRYTT